MRFFSQLTGQDLHCVQTTCESMGADRNHFVLGKQERVKPAEAWLDEKHDHATIMERLCHGQAIPVPSGLQAPVSRPASQAPAVAEAMGSRSEAAISPHAEPVNLTIADASHKPSAIAAPETPKQDRAAVSTAEIPEETLELPASALVAPTNETKASEPEVMPLIPSDSLGTRSEPEVSAFIAEPTAPEQLDPDAPLLISDDSMAESPGPDAMPLASEEQTSPISEDLTTEPFMADAPPLALEEPMVEGSKSNAMLLEFEEPMVEGSKPASIPLEEEPIAGASDPNLVALIATEFGTEADESLSALDLGQEQTHDKQVDPSIAVSLPEYRENNVVMPNPEVGVPEEKDHG